MNQSNGLLFRPAVWTAVVCFVTILNCGVVPNGCSLLSAQDGIFDTDDDEPFGDGDLFGSDDSSDEGSSDDDFGFGFGEPEGKKEADVDVSDLSAAEQMEPKPAPPTVDLTPVDETLIKAWQGQIRVGSNGSAPIGFELHAHATKRLQKIHVTVGKRMVASFNADDFGSELAVSAAGSSSRSGGSATRTDGSSTRQPAGGSDSRPAASSFDSENSDDDTDDIFGTGSGGFDEGADDSSPFGDGFGSDPLSNNFRGSNSEGEEASPTRSRTTLVAAKAQGSGTREEGSSTRSSGNATALQTSGSNSRTNSGSATRESTAANSGSGTRTAGSGTRDGSDTRSGSGTKPSGSGSRPTPNPATMTIGFKNAMARADKIVNRLEILGKQPNIELIDRAMTFLATTSSDGFVQVMDAETGEILWNAAVGSPSRPTLAAKMSDEYLSVVNGRQLYVFDLISGRLLNERTLDDIPGAPATPIGDWIVVPSLRGGVTCYSATDLQQQPWKQRFGGNMYDAATASHDRRFVAWPTTLGHVYLAEMDRRASIWNRLQTRGEIATSPIPVDNGFIIASTRGNIVRIAHPTKSARQTRGTGLIWKHNVGTNVGAHVLASSDTVAMATKENKLKTVSLETGRSVWDSPTPNVSDVFAISATRIYVKTSNEQLGIVDKLTGKPLEVMPGKITDGLHNSLNDRIYLYDPSGKITCYRERGRPEPLQHFTAVGRELDNGSKSGGLANANAVETKQESQAGSTFGFGDIDEPVTFGDDAGSDPFGTSGGDSDDEFDIFD